MQAIRKSKPRERLLFTLLAETGIRINEALGIYVEDIVLSAGQERAFGSEAKENTSARSRCLSCADSL